MLWALWVLQECSEPLISLDQFGLFATSERRTELVRLNLEYVQRLMLAGRKINHLKAWGRLLQGVHVAPHMAEDFGVRSILETIRWYYIYSVASPSSLLTWLHEEPLIAHSLMVLICALNTVVTRSMVKSACTLLPVHHSWSAWWI